MKIKSRPLQNPDPEDFNQPAVDAEILEPENIEVEISKDQLALNLDNRSVKVKQTFNGFRTIFRRRNDFIEISQIWKTPAFPFAIVSTIFNIGIFFLIAIFRFNDVPPTIPVLYNSVNKNWIQVDKSIIFMFPVFLGIISFVIIQFSTVIFRKDRRLALTMVWIQSFLNILFFAAILQIFSLIVD